MRCYVKKSLTSGSFYEIAFDFAKPSSHSESIADSLEADSLEHRSRCTCKVHSTHDRTSLPSEHRFHRDSHRQSADIVDAANFQAKLIETTLLGLFGAELKASIASIAQSQKERSIRTFFLCHKYIWVPQENLSRL